MLKLKNYQQYILGILATFILFILGFAILAISLFQTNRQSADSIKQFSTEVINPHSN